MLNDLGLKNPQVYIHTGNWVFESNENKEILSLKISEAIKKKYAWEVPIMVISATDFQSIFNNCPFEEGKKEQSYFTLLGSVPLLENSTALKALHYNNEEFFVSPTCIYTFYAQGAGKAKLTNTVLEKKLKVAATSRNYNTMQKLVAISND